MCIRKKKKRKWKIVGVEQKQEMEAKSSSNGGDDEVAIFTHTNMGTHIAVAVSPHISTFDFQKEVERTHLSCFPKLGEVEACKVMVKRKACFYCLPKSLLIKYAFRGLEKPWFLHVEMSPLSCLEKHIARDCDVHISDDRNAADSITGNTEMNDMVLSYKKKCLNTILVKPEGVLNTCPFSKKKRKKKKCVDKCLGRGAGADSEEKCQDACDRISGLVPLAKSSRNEFEMKTKVGKRILSAAYKLKVSRNKQRPPTYLFRSCLRAPPGIASAIFEISDSDD